MPAQVSWRLPGHAFEAAAGVEPVQQSVSAAAPRRCRRRQAAGQRRRRLEERLNVGDEEVAAIGFGRQQAWRRCQGFRSSRGRPAVGAGRLRGERVFDHQLEIARHRRRSFSARRSIRSQSSGLTLIVAARSLVLLIANSRDGVTMVRAARSGNARGAIHKDRDKCFE
jgi:hypothetical protein